MNKKGSESRLPLVELKIIWSFRLWNTALILWSEKEYFFFFRFIFFSLCWHSIRSTWTCRRCVVAICWWCQFKRSLVSHSPFPCRPTTVGDERKSNDQVQWSPFLLHSFYYVFSLFFFSFQFGTFSRSLCALPYSVHVQLFRRQRAFYEYLLASFSVKWASSSSKRTK